MKAKILLSVAQFWLLYLKLHFLDLTQALNCKSFSPEEAKFAVENFHQIPLGGTYSANLDSIEAAKSPSKKEHSSKIVAHFIESLRHRLLLPQNETIDGRGTIEKNGRKMVTMATDICNRLPTQRENLQSGYIQCVQFLLYHHMQKLVWRLKNKWGIFYFGTDFGSAPTKTDQNKNDQENSPKNFLLEIYTDKKMRAWDQMVKIYGKELKDLTEINDQIRRKFEFCLIIEGETQLKCDPINIGSAEFFVKNFHRTVFEPEYEQKRSKKAELIGTHIFNALRGAAARRRRDDGGEDEAEEAWEKASKAWKLEERGMRVRVQVLVNTAERKCRGLAKNPFKNFKKLGRNLSKKLQKSWSLSSGAAAEPPVERHRDWKAKNAKDGAEAAAKAAADEAENALDELSSDFVSCIFHYMYAYSLTLITKIEAKNERFDKNLREIYEKLREKARKRMAMAFYFDGLNEMDKWLNGEKAPSSGEAEGNEDEEAVEDPFKNCANVTDQQHIVEENNQLLIGDGLGRLMDKSFDEYLFQCASQFIEAVAGDQFDYKLFVNLHTKQLDTAMEFPTAMKTDKMPPADGGQSANDDKCFMMRELLISLNKNLAHRLNFEKITTRKEKERWTKMHQKYENLRLEKLDNNWLHRMGAKMSQSYENLVRDFRKWSAKGTLTHPIRDEYRKARAGMARLSRSFSIRRRKKRGNNNNNKRTKTNNNDNKTNNNNNTDKKRTSNNNKANNNSDKKQTNNNDNGEQHQLQRQRTLRELLEEQQPSAWGKNVHGTCAEEEGEAADDEFSSGESRKTLSELFAEENFETPEIVIAKIDRKMEEMRAKIADNPLGKRLTIYQMFFRAFYIALAIELFERMENRGTTNWHFVLRAADDEGQTKVGAEKCAKNVENVKKQLKVFDDIVKRMGKTMPSASSPIIKWKFWGKKAAAATPRRGRQMDENDNNNDDDDDSVDDEEEEQSSKSIGFELRFLGYTTENDGQQLLESLQDEMQLNLDQFNMSFDGQCDLTNDLNDCFVASDGIDFDAQLENASLFGKEMGQMGALERAAESLFKKLNRWSYKFGQKGKRNRNMLKRFFNGKIKAILGVIPKMMTDQVSPFELVIPFYLPMKNLVKYTFKKVLVKPNEWLRAWVVNLFSTANFFINEGDEKVKQPPKAKKGNKDPIERIELAGVAPSINVPNIDQSLNGNLDPIIKQMTKMAEKTGEAKKTKKKSRKINLTKFKQIAKMLKDVFTNFGLKRAQAEVEKGVGHGQTKRVANPSGTRKRRRRRGIETGAGINAYIAAGKQGSSTVGALLIDAKVVDWSLTTPLPGLHLHWLHIGHPIMLGKYNIAMSLTTGIVVIFIIVGMLYWWHALKLAVYLAILYGDPIGWVVIFLASIFYIIFCVGFVMG